MGRDPTDPTAEEIPGAPVEPAADEQPIDAPFHTLDGQPRSLQLYRGLPLLIVNTACRDSRTGQLSELQQLHDRYSARGLIVFGFPCADFGTELSSDVAVAQYVLAQFEVQFPMCARLRCSGPEIAPLYQALTTCPLPRFRGPVEGTFTKFLLDPDGLVVERLGPDTSVLSHAFDDVLQSTWPTTVT